MNIYAEEGDKVICSTLNAGYDSDQRKAEAHLVLNQVYTVSCTIVHNWSTDVYLQEIPDVKFDSVFFEDVKE